MLDFKFILDENYVMYDFFYNVADRKELNKFLDKGLLNFIYSNKFIKIIELNELVDKYQKEYLQAKEWAIKQKEYSDFLAEAQHFQSYMVDNWENNKVEVNTFLKRRIKLPLTEDKTLKVYVSNPTCRKVFANSREGIFYFSNNQGLNMHDNAYYPVYLLHESLHILLPYKKGYTFGQLNTVHGIIELACDCELYSILSGKDKYHMGHRELVQIKEELRPSWQEFLDNPNMTLDQYAYKKAEEGYLKEKEEMTALPTQSYEVQKQFFLKHINDSRNNLELAIGTCVIAIDDFETKDYKLLKTMIKVFVDLNHEDHPITLTKTGEKKLKSDFDLVIYWIMDELIRRKIRDDKDNGTAKLNDLFENGLETLSECFDGDFSLVKGSKEKGFNFNYILYIPKDIKNKTLIVEGNNTGGRSIADQDLYSAEYIRPSFSSSGLFNIYSQVDAPLMIPLIPMPNITNEEPSPK
ncbi:MAG: hypothetical protein PHX62_08535, partial [Bacilli bacterium]|nr:hypothetical protein [Bacilli bacterium]